MTKREQTGITLVELLVSIAILSILLAWTFPSFQGSFARYRVNGAADGMHADMHFTKAEAIKRAIPVKLIITAGPPWSYCVTLTDCANGVLKTVNAVDFPGTTLTSTRSLPLTISFNPLRGTTSQATTITFSGGNNRASVVLSSIGRIRRQ